MSDAGQLRGFWGAQSGITGWPTKNRYAAESELLEAIWPSLLDAARNSQCIPCGGKL